MSCSIGNTEHNPSCPLVDCCDECWPLKDTKRRKVGVETPEGAELMQKINASNIDPKFEDRYWRIDSFILIDNPKLNRLFEESKIKLQNLGRQSESLNDIIVFSIESDRRCKDISEEGCKVGSKKRHILGHVGSGVHMVRHYDILTRYLAYQQYAGPINVVVYKTFLGASKPIVPRLHKDDNFVPPQAGFDCHISATNVHKEMPICEALNCSYVYLYEFDDVSSNTVKYPRQILPYAIIHLKKKKKFFLTENPFLAVASPDSASNLEVKGETRRGFRFVFSNSGLKGKHKVFAKGGYRTGIVESTLKGQILEMRTKAPKSVSDAKPPLLQRIDDREFNEENEDVTNPPDLQQFICSPVKPVSPILVSDIDKDCLHLVSPHILHRYPKLRLRPFVKLKRLAPKLPRTFAEIESVQPNEKDNKQEMCIQACNQETDDKTKAECDLPAREHNVHDNDSYSAKSKHGAYEPGMPVVSTETGHEKPSHAGAGRSTGSSRLKRQKQQFGSVKFTVSKDGNNKSLKFASMKSKRKSGTKKVIGDMQFHDNQYAFTGKPKDSADLLKLNLAKRIKRYEQEQMKKDLVSSSNEALIHLTERSKETSLAETQNDKPNYDAQEKQASKGQPIQQMVLEKSKSPVVGNAAPECLNLNPVLSSANISSLASSNDPAQADPTAISTIVSDIRSQADDLSVNESIVMNKHDKTSSKKCIFETEMQSFLREKSDSEGIRDILFKNFQKPVNITYCVNTVLRTATDQNKTTKYHNADSLQRHCRTSNESVSEPDLFTSVREASSQNSRKQFENEPKTPSALNIEYSVHKVAHTCGKLQNDEEKVSKCANSSRKQNNDIESTVACKNVSENRILNARGEKETHIETTLNADSNVSAIAVKEPNQITKKLENLKASSSKPDTSNNLTNKSFDCRSEKKSSSRASKKAFQSKAKSPGGVIHVNNNVVECKQQQLLSNVVNAGQGSFSIQAPNMAELSKCSDNPTASLQQTALIHEEHSQNVKVDSATAKKLRSFLNTTAAAALQNKKTTSKDTDVPQEKEIRGRDQIGFVCDKQVRIDTDPNHFVGDISEHNQGNGQILRQEFTLEQPATSGISCPQNYKQTFDNAQMETSADSRSDDCATQKEKCLDAHSFDSLDTVIGGDLVSLVELNNTTSVFNDNSLPKELDTITTSLNSVRDVLRVSTMKQETSSKSESGTQLCQNLSLSVSDENIPQIASIMNADGVSPNNFSLPRVKQEPIDAGYEEPPLSFFQKTHTDNKCNLSESLQKSVDELLPKTRQELAKGISMLNATECRTAIIDTLKELSNVLKYLTGNNAQKKTDEEEMVAKTMYSALTEINVKKETCEPEFKAQTLGTSNTKSMVKIKTEPVDTHLGNSKHLANSPIQEPCYEYIIKSDDDEVDTDSHNPQSIVEVKCNELLTSGKTHFSDFMKERDTQSEFQSDTPYFDELPQLLDISKEPDINSFELFGLPHEGVKKRKTVSSQTHTTNQRNGLNDVSYVVKPVLNTSEENNQKCVQSNCNANIIPQPKCLLKDISEIKAEKDIDFQPIRWNHNQAFNLKTGVLNKGLKERKNMFDLKTRQSVVNRNIRGQKYVSYPSRKTFIHKPSVDLEKTDIAETTKTTPETQKTDTSTPVEESSSNGKSSDKEALENKNTETDIEKATNTFLSSECSLVTVKTEPESNANLIDIKTEPDVETGDSNLSNHVSTEHHLEIPAHDTCHIPTNKCQTSEEYKEEKTKLGINKQKNHERDDKKREKEKVKKTKSVSKQAVIPFQTVVRLKRWQFWKFKRGETSRKFIDYRELYDKLQKDRKTSRDKSTKNKNSKPDKSANCESDKTIDSVPKLPYHVPKNRTTELSARGTTLIEDNLGISDSELQEPHKNQKRKRSSSKDMRSSKRIRESSGKTSNKSDKYRKTDGDSNRSRSKSSHRSSKNKSSSPSARRTSVRHSRDIKSSSERNRSHASRRSSIYRSTKVNNRSVSRWSLTQRFPAKSVFAKSGTGYFSWRRKYHPRRSNNEDYVILESGNVQTKDEYDRWIRFKERESIRMQIEKAIKEYRRTFENTPDDTKGDEKVASYLEYLTTKLDQLQNKRNKLNFPGKRIIETNQNSGQTKKRSRRRRNNKRVVSESKLKEKLGNSRKFHQYETIQNSSTARLSKTLANDGDNLIQKQLQHASTIEDLLREHISKHCDTLTKRIKQEITLEFEELSNRKANTERELRDGSQDRSHENRTRANVFERIGYTKRDKSVEKINGGADRHRSNRSRDRYLVQSSESHDRERNDSLYGTRKESFRRSSPRRDRCSRNDNFRSGNETITRDERRGTHTNPLNEASEQRQIDFNSYYQNDNEGYRGRFHDDNIYKDKNGDHFDKYDFQQNYDKYNQAAYNSFRVSSEYTSKPYMIHSTDRKEPALSHVPSFDRKQWLSSNYNRHRSNYDTSLIKSSRKSDQDVDTSVPTDEFDATLYRKFVPRTRQRPGHGTLSYRTTQSFQPRTKPHYQPAKFSRFRNPRTYYFYDNDKPSSSASKSCNTASTEMSSTLEITASLRNEETCTRSTNESELANMPQSIPSITSTRFSRLRLKR